MSEVSGQSADIYQTLSDEQLDAMLADPEMRGPGQRRLKQEKDRRAAEVTPNG